MSDAPRTPPGNTLPQADQDDLVGEGFPPEAINAFLATADATNCVILSRTPGRAALDLIQRRFDLKGFFNKTKSCDWGPMAGFVCMYPPFNKGGAAPKKIKDNIGYLAKFVDSYYALNKAAPNPFCPILIPQSRIAEFAGFMNKPNSQGIVIDRSVPDMAMGFAYDTDKTIVIEFMLKKQTEPGYPSVIANDPAWEVWCGVVWQKVAGVFTEVYPTDNWFAPLAKIDDNVNDLATLRTVVSATFGAVRANEYEKTWTTAALAIRKTQWATIRQSIAGLPDEPDDAAEQLPTSFSWVMGCINPHPPYLSGPVGRWPAANASMIDKDAVPRPPPYNDYRNCVSGDFDLFAVWPRVMNLFAENVAPIDMLIRWAEGLDAYMQGPSQRVRLDPNEPLLRRAGDKTLSRRLTAAPNVILEFVPAIETSDGVESGEYGNINPAVNKIANMLNSQLYYFYNKPELGGAANPHFVRVAVNNAFHSDEGGRPYVKDIDLPVAIFLPQPLQLVDTRNPPRFAPTRAMLIETPDVMATVIKLLKFQCLVPFQAAWFAVLIEVAEGDPRMKPVLQELVLGQPPYTANHDLAYDSLRDALRNALGAYNADTMQFARFLGPVSVVPTLLATVFDDLAVPPDPVPAAPNPPPPQ